MKRHTKADRDTERRRDGRQVEGMAGMEEMGVGCPNKHFRKLHAFVKTKQCAKCLFVLVSAFERKNDSTQKQKLQPAGGEMNAVE